MEEGAEVQNKLFQRLNMICADHCVRVLRVSFSKSLSSWRDSISILME
jgi:hypothetical protein